MQCVSTWTKKGISAPLPCGRCYACKTKRAQGWSFRLLQEAKNSTSALFVTLTYSPENLPLTKSGYKTLDKKEIPEFIKRLRSHHDYELKKCGHSGKDIKPIKYYGVGEYGGKTMRPHYHIIIFNADQDLIIKAWDKGHIHIGKLTPASAAYTLKYVSKAGKIPVHRNDDRLKEFSLMSKGLGKSYINEKTISWHKEKIGERYYIPHDGKKLSLPRYYKDRIYTLEDRIEVQQALRWYEKSKAKFYLRWWSKEKYDKLMTKENLSKLELAKQFIRKQKQYEKDDKIKEGLQLP